MITEYYFEYCKGILGVKTNIRDFKWVYGSIAPLVSYDEYKKCIVKFDVCVKPEKQLSEISCCTRKFQAYMWDENSQTIYYRRKFVSHFQVGYNIKISGNTVFAEIGEHYYKFIKYRTMNLHGMYYLLSDIANMILLNNGLLTLYASAVYYKLQQNGIVCFAPPNTGKTLTVMKMCESHDYAMLGEDVIITDGKRLFACPWTSSFRLGKGRSFLDSAGAFSRAKKANNYNVCEECGLSDVVVLSLGEKKIIRDKRELLRQICVLNGYLFNYFSSPIIKVLAFVENDYCKQWWQQARSILEGIVADCNCYGIQSEYPQDFQNIISGNICDSVG